VLRGERDHDYVEGLRRSLGIHFPMDGLPWVIHSAKAILLGFGCREEVPVGSGVSEVQAAFVTTPATMYGALAPL
jgi:hypothetical protein